MRNEKDTAAFYKKLKKSLKTTPNGLLFICINLLFPQANQKFQKLRLYLIIPMLKSQKETRLKVLIPVYR